MSNIKLAIPFFLVKNMEQSLQFYVEILGFSMSNQWTPRGRIEWCMLERDAVSIMLQEPRNFDAEIRQASVRSGIGFSICFQCGDALALYKEFTNKGLTIREPFVGNNMWVVSFKDPDGYNLDFESKTDVPEETTYSEYLQKNIST
jgi:predicted lactoylglutathione lyase